MSKSFDKIPLNYFFNIKYIIVHDDTYSYSGILEKILNFPWDVREISATEKAIFECIKAGVINPNYIFIHKKDTLKIEEEYTNHLFSLIIRMDNGHQPNEVNETVEFLLRGQGKFNNKISDGDIINFNQIDNNFDINHWICNRMNHFSNTIFNKYFPKEIAKKASEGENPLKDLNERELEVLDKAYALIEELKALSKKEYSNKRFNFSRIIKCNEFLTLNNLYPSEGLMINVFEYKYYYYGKYSRNLEIQQPNLKKLAYLKLENHSVEDIKERLLVPVFYATVNNFALFSLNYDINRIRQEVNLLVDYCRTESSKYSTQKKKYNISLSKLLNNLNKKMQSYDEIVSLINFLQNKDAYFHVKLYSSLPIGWLNINGCPLALRHYYSLLPRHSHTLSSPKNLAIIKKEPLKVLIIRSFEENDPLKTVMERTLKLARKDYSQTQDELEHLVRNLSKIIPNVSTDSIKIEKSLDEINEKDLYAQYRFVDVDSEEKLINTLNEATESILIFDCHGTKIDDQGNYGLYLYGKAINLDDFSDKIKKLPPIVIFSACDSLPLNANQMTSPTQNAINLGAYVAIGTYLPIDGKQASIAIARLIHRLQHYVDIVISDLDKINFINIFQGWLIMEYTREILYCMRDDGLIQKDELYNTIQPLVNCIINPLQSNWFDKFLDILQNNIDRFSHREEIISYIQKHIAITDSMKYVCVGFPEKVWLSDNSEDFPSELYDIIQN